MKKILILLIAFVFITPNAFAEIQEIWYYIHVCDGEGFWDYYPEYGVCKPTTIVQNCFAIPESEYEPGRVYLVVGGYLLHAKLDNVGIHYRADPTSTTWTTSSRSGSNYRFMPNDRLRIDQCPAYPGLVGIEVSISGILTDENGNFVVFIPSGVNP